MVIEEADWLKSMTGHAIREINITPALSRACCRLKSKPIKSNRAHFKPLPFKLFQNAQLHFCTTQELFAHSNNFLGNACKKL